MEPGRGKQPAGPPRCGALPAAVLRGAAWCAASRQNGDSQQRAPRASPYGAKTLLFLEVRSRKKRVKILAVIVSQQRPELRGLKSLEAEFDAVGGGCRAMVAAAARDGSQDVSEPSSPRRHYFMKNHGPWNRRRAAGAPPHLLPDLVRLNFGDG
jgi:hypothetical protein